MCERLFSDRKGKNSLFTNEEKLELAVFALLNLYLFRCPLNMVHSLYLLVHVDVLTIFHPPVISTY